MRTSFRLLAAMAVALAVALPAAGCGKDSPSTSTADPAACPDGKIRFGVEPYESAADLLPAFQPIAAQLEQKLGCKVELTITTTYTSEIEAMRAGKLEVGQFGALGYVFARELAKAKVIATYADESGQAAVYYAMIVTNAKSGLTGDQTACKGKQMAYSEASSTSGYLYPAFAFKSVGIDPKNGVKAVFTGGHAQAYEAVKANRVECAELNSERIDVARQAGQYNAADFVTLWKSPPIFTDLIAVRGDLKPELQKKITDAFLSLDLTQVESKSPEILLGKSMVTASEGDYKVVADLVQTMGIDIKSLD